MKKLLLILAATILSTSSLIGCAREKVKSNTTAKPAAGTSTSTPEGAQAVAELKVQIDEQSLFAYSYADFGIGAIIQANIIVEGQPNFFYQIADQVTNIVTTQYTTATNRYEVSAKCSEFTEAKCGQLGIVVKSFLLSNNQEQGYVWGVYNIDLSTGKLGSVETSRAFVGASQFTVQQLIGNL